MSKQSRPNPNETELAKLSRALRRHPGTVDDPDAARIREEQEQIRRRGGDSDASARTQSGHGKKTADKWNQ